MRTRFLALAAACVLSGCGGPSADTMAQETTTAIYANDYAGTTKYFDSTLKDQVTRQSLGQLSDRMHGLGKIRSFKPLHGDSSTGVYEFTVDMDKGPLIVFVRLDPQHKISGFRIAPPHS